MGQPDSYKDALLPKDVPKMSVEAAVTMGWGEFADAFVGINVFGASAPGGTCMDKFGFNVPNVVTAPRSAWRAPRASCRTAARGSIEHGSAPPWGRPNFSDARNFRAEL